MLQISSGKLFTREIERENLLRGVIYTNLKVNRDQPIKTMAGSLLPTSNLRNSLAIIYEFTELIESVDQGRNHLVSHGIDPYLADFSSILSFTLNCVATPTHELTTRLIDNQKSPLTLEKPRQLVHRFFDSEIVFKAEEEEFLKSFIKQLIGLERRYFLGVMRAIRTYVTGMHRVTDDLELAYTLLVASLESLAQDFDGHESDWGDYDENKRRAIDLALDGACPDVGERVRSAILKSEHTSLGRRFRDFTQEHIASSFFRDGVEDSARPIARRDLHSALNNAYRARSKYIHNLRELPRVLVLTHSNSESKRIEGKPWFTIQGLARLARHVIIEFVYKQNIVETEDYDYEPERAGIVQIPFAPKYWIWKTDQLNSKSGHKWLESFLSQLTSWLKHEEDASVTDITKVLETVEGLLATSKKAERLPFIALYCLFNELCPNDKRMPNFEKIVKKFGPELDAPSPESLVVDLLINTGFKWTISDREKALQAYFDRRYSKTGFCAFRLLEAAMILVLAEQVRLSQDQKKTRELICLAVESYPECKNLRDFEQNYLIKETSIDWKSILTPQHPSGASEKTPNNTP